MFASSSLHLKLTEIQLLLLVPITAVKHSIVKHEAITAGWHESALKPKLLLLVRVSFDFILTSFFWKSSKHCSRSSSNYYRILDMELNTSWWRSNGLQWNSLKMTRNMFRTKSYIKDVPVPRSVKLIVHQMRPAWGHFMPSAQENVALKLIWQERHITRMSLVSPNESGPSQSRNDKQRCWRGCTILFGNSLVIH